MTPKPRHPPGINGSVAFIGACGLLVGVFLVDAMTGRAADASLACALVFAVTLMGLYGTWRVQAHAREEDDALGSGPVAPDQLEQALESVRSIAGSVANRNVVFGIVASATWLLFATQDIGTAAGADLLLQAAPKAFATTGLAVLGGVAIAALGDRWEMFLRWRCRPVSRVGDGDAAPDVGLADVHAELQRIVQRIGGLRAPVDRTDEVIESLTLLRQAILSDADATEGAREDRLESLLQRVVEHLQPLASIPDQAAWLASLDGRLAGVVTQVQHFPTAAETAPRLDAILQELGQLRQELTVEDPAADSGDAPDLAVLVDAMGDLKDATTLLLGELQQAVPALQTLGAQLPADQQGRADHAAAMRELSRALQGADSELLEQHLRALHAELRNSTAIAMRDFGSAARDAYRDVTRETVGTLEGAVRTAYANANAQAARELERALRAVTQETTGMVKPLVMLAKQLDQVRAFLARLSKAMGEVGLESESAAVRCDGAARQLVDAVGRLGGGADGVDVDVLARLATEIDRAATTLESAERQLVSRLVVIDQHEAKLSRARAALTRSLSGADVEAAR